MMVLSLVDIPIHTGLWRLEDSQQGVFVSAFQKRYFVSLQDEVIECKCWQCSPSLVWLWPNILCLWSPSAKVKRPTTLRIKFWAWPFTGQLTTGNGESFTRLAIKDMEAFGVSGTSSRGHNRYNKEKANPASNPKSSVKIHRSNQSIYYQRASTKKSTQNRSFFYKPNQKYSILGIAPKRSMIASLLLQVAIWKMLTCSISAARWWTQSDILLQTA